mgnify:CR=1 FL=1
MPHTPVACLTRAPRWQFVKHQLHFFIAEFVLRGDVEVAYASFHTSSWSFVVRKAPLDWGRVRDFSFASRTAEQWAAIATQIDALVLRLAADFRPTPAALANLQSRIREQHEIKLRPAKKKRAVLKAKGKAVG